MRISVLLLNWGGGEVPEQIEFTHSGSLVAAGHLRIYIS